jgi:D-xylose transport system substrate-binding protein
MKTKLLGLITTIVVMAMVMTACSTPAATSSPTSAPTEAATMAATTAATEAATSAPTEAATMAATTAATEAATAAATTAATEAATSAATPGGTGAVPSVLASMTPPPNLSGKIALLLPETKTTRYETADKPYFEERVKQLCPSCEIIYSNANQDANAQLSQAEAALTNGAQVLVLDPVDSKSAGAIADKAKAQGVPVIAYDRLVQNSDGVNYYLSFDNTKVGQLQAQALVDALNKANISNPSIVMINGAPTDANAAQFKAGAHSVFDPLVTAGKLTIAKEYDTPDWSPNNAQTEMQQALTALGNKVDGVYAANDGTAGGAYAAMKAAGVSPIPPLTGQDAELAAIQRIISDQQTMTVYKAIKPEAYSAAELAVALLAKQDVSGLVQNKVNNGATDVPFVQLTPVAVTKDNVKTTVVADQFWTVQQICTTDYAAACTAVGLTQ